jgi:hypothetical protein
MKELEEKIIPLEVPRRAQEDKRTPEMNRFLKAQEEIIRINNELIQKFDSNFDLKNTEIRSSLNPPVDEPQQPSTKPKINIFTLNDPILKPKVSRSKVTGELLLDSKPNKTSSFDIDYDSASSDMEDDDKLSKKSNSSSSSKAEFKDASSSPTKRANFSFSPKEEFGISTPKKEFNFDFKKETTEVQPQPKEIPQEPVSKLAPFSLKAEAEKELIGKQENLEKLKEK